MIRFDYLGFDFVNDLPRYGVSFCGNYNPFERRHAGRAIRNELKAKIHRRRTPCFRVVMSLLPAAKPKHRKAMRLRLSLLRRLIREAAAFEQKHRNGVTL
jgi:hypothetical protein